MSWPISVLLLSVMILLMLGATTTPTTTSPSTPTTAPSTAKRIVCLGDSITDGHTYPMLVIQGLTEGGLEAPVMINAGIGGDNGAGMLARIDHDVFVHEPDLVIIANGINDGQLSADEYRATMQRLIDRCKEKKIPVMLATTSVLAPSHARAEPHYAEFNKIVHELAAANGYVVAEVHDRMSDAGEGAPLQEPDGAHLNFEGYRWYARAILDALGHPDIAVPKEMKIEPLRGIIKEWKIRALQEDVAVTPETVGAIKPDETWKDYTLPEGGHIESWWPETQRKRGIAMSLDKLIGPAKIYQGYAIIHAEDAKKVYVNTGSSLRAVWLNGKEIYRATVPRGWHPGADRIEATLNKGDNTVIIESGHQFFLSVTDDNRW